MFYLTYIWKINSVLKATVWSVADVAGVDSVIMLYVSNNTDNRWFILENAKYTVQLASELALVAVYGKVTPFDK